MFQNLSPFLSAHKYRERNELTASKLPKCFRFAHPQFPLIEAADGHVFDLYLRPLRFPAQYRNYPCPCQNYNRKFRDCFANLHMDSEISSESASAASFGRCWYVMLKLCFTRYLLERIAAAKL